MSTMQKIFVGDVQGCASEFEELIARAESRFGRDFELWSVGDLVNRGPRNLRALEVMRELVEDGRGRVVLGNHELSLLRIWLGVLEPRPQDSAVEVLESAEADDWMKWLCTRPVVETGDLEGSRFVMVHASAHPDWGLEETLEHAARVEARLAVADIDALQTFLDADVARDDAELERDRDVLGRFTRCRSIDDSGRWSSANPERSEDAWHHRWAQEHHDYGVVYGHWAIQGLHVEDALRGLDTGCVHHGRGRDGFLTAWVPEAIRESNDPFAAPDDRLWQIPAHRRYYEG